MLCGNGLIDSGSGYGREMSTKDLYRKVPRSSIVAVMADKRRRNAFETAIRFEANCGLFLTLVPSI